MAKLKAPLLSLGASQQLGKTLVFSSWKGINTVREYVIPSNPKTALQLVQRAYVTAAVAMVHTAQARAGSALASDDQVANSALASAKGLIMTWFNQMVKLWIDVKVTGKSPIVYSDGKVWNTGAIQINIFIYLNEETPSDLAAGKFFFGTSKTNLINTQVAVIDPGVSASIPTIDLSAFITVGVKYFWQFRPDVADPCEGSNSGIYNFVAT